MLKRTVLPVDLLILIKEDNLPVLKLVENMVKVSPLDKTKDVVL